MHIDPPQALASVVEALPADSRVLITGGSGFIGTNLVEALVPRATVSNIDLVKPRKLDQGRYWTALDVCDLERLRDHVRSFRPTIVLHAAARTDLKGRRIEDYQTNTVGTGALLETLDSIEFKGTAVFFSSMLANRLGETSGDLGQGNPDTHYGESKLLMEERIRAAKLAYQYTVVRPTSIWGPWFAEPYRNFFQMVIQGRYFNPGGRSATKTFGFVSNSVYQVLTLITQRMSSAGPIYLGDYPPVSVEDWAREIASMAGASPPRHVPKLVGTLAALGGDAMGRLGITLPLTTRRLQNMRQDNVVDLGWIMAAAPSPPFTRQAGTRLTLNWMMAARS